MHTVTLEKGLTIGSETFKVVELKELTAGDVLAAMEESERVVMVPTPNGLEPTLLMSNAMMGVNTLRRQIKSIGKFEGPLEREQLNLLSDKDLDLLQKGTEAMDLALAKAVIERGRSDATSSDD